MTTIITCAADAAPLCAHYAAAEQEHFVALFLNTRHRPIKDAVMVAKGTADAALVHPRDVFREAVRANASAIIVAHNHPGGDPTPSDQDRALTEHFQDAGRLLGIPVLDHLILCEGGRGYSHSAGREFVWTA